MPLGKSRDQDLYKAAKSGDVAAIDRLLGSRKKGKGSVRKGPKGPNPNVQDSCGMTPLHYAALNGHSDVAQLLLLSGASAHVADHSGSYPIHLAAWKGDSEVAKTLVERGPSRADVNARSDCQETALHLSAQYGNTDVVEYLLEKRADPRLQNNKGETPLELAALFGHVDVVRSITRCHPDLLQQNFVKTSPLHLAARNGHVSVIASLITAGMDVNTLCDSGSVLHEAALFGKTEVVQFLTTKGIDASLVDKDGKTAVDVLDLYPSHRTEKIKNIISSSISSDTLEPSTQGKGSGFPDNSATMSGVANPVYDNVVRVGDSFVPNGAPHEGEPTKATMYYAVARVDYEDISNPSVLPLRTGGRVQVIGSNTNGAWVGVADGRKGTFFASHVDFYQTMVDGVKKISSEDIDKALLYLVSSSNGQGSPPTTWKRFSDSQILSNTSPPFQDVAAARSNSTYAQLHPVLEDAHTTQQTTQNSHYLNASTATKATFTMATTPTADYEHAKMSLQEAIKDGHVGSHLPPTQEVGPNQYLNLSMGAHSYLNFEEAQRRSSEYITPPKMIHTEKNRKDLHRLPHERQLSKDEIAFMSDSWSENKFDRIAGDDRSLVHQTRPRIVSLGDLESDLQREAHSTVDEELEEGIFLRKEITTPEMGNVLRGRNPFLGGGARGSRKYRSALLFGKPNNFVPEQPLSPSSPPTPPTPSRVSREQLQLSDDVPLSISFDPHPPRCYEWSKPRSFGEGQTSHHIEDMPQVSVSAPTQPTPQVYDNVVLKPKPRKKTSILHSHSESAAHPNPVDVQRMELGKMNYENIGVILQKQQIQGTSPPNVTGISPIKDNTSVLTPPIPAPRTRPVSCVQPPTYENVVFKKQSSTVPEGVVICDNGNVYAGLILASKSFSTTKDRSRLHSFWTQHKDQEAWVQVDTLIHGIEGSVDDIGACIQEPNRAVGLVEWLNSLGLAGYASVFESHGFDSLDFLGEGILDKSDLNEMRIVDPGAQSSILTAVEVLAPPPETAQHTDLKPWLKAIGLEYLYTEMVANGYSSLKSVVQLEPWDIQLGNKGIRITLLGHQKRFLHCIAQLKGVHPEWVEQEVDNRKPGLLKPRVISNSTLSKSLEDVSFCKDYSTLVGKTTQKETPKSDPLSPDTSWDRVRSLNLSPRPVTRKLSNVSIRPPTVAQSDAWRLAKEAQMEEMDHLLENTQPFIGHQEEWRHPVETLLNLSVEYTVFYLGSLLLKTKKLSAEEAVTKLKVSNALLSKHPQVLLSISWQWARYLDIQSHNIISEHSIHHISSSSQDSSDMSVFSYNTNESGLVFCHVFRASSKDVSDDIVMTLGQAFEVAYQKVLRARGNLALHSAQSNTNTVLSTSQQGLSDEELKTLSLGPDK